MLKWDNHRQFETWFVKGDNLRIKKGTIDNQVKKSRIWNIGYTNLDQKELDKLKKPDFDSN